MREDPIEVWRRLTGLYGEKSDDELRELAADFVDLTEVAQRVLRDELQKRGMDEPRAACEAPKDLEGRTAPRWDSGAKLSRTSDASQTSDLPREYTWKTLLCECDEPEQAWQISEVLRQAGIESWIEGPRSSFYLELSNPRVLVAADRLDEAPEIAARPIPQEIIDQSKMELPDFEPPACPSCGDGERVLEGVNPSNTWRCDTCGKQWTKEPGVSSETKNGKSSVL
jgi:ribosomal protein L37AE/L43A